MNESKARKIASALDFFVISYIRLCELDARGATKEEKQAYENSKKMSYDILIEDLMLPDDK